EQVLKAARQSNSKFDFYVKDVVKVFKPRDGKNMIRILPPTWEDAEHYSYTLQLVYGEGPDSQTYLSRHRMLGEPDPLHEAYLQAQKEKNKKLADALEPKKRAGIYVIDRNAEEEGVQFWPAP